MKKILCLLVCFLSVFASCNDNNEHEDFYVESADFSKMSLGESQKLIFGTWKTRIVGFAGTDYLSIVFSNDRIYVKKLCYTKNEVEFVFNVEKWYVSSDENIVVSYWDHFFDNEPKLCSIKFKGIKNNELLLIFDEEVVPSFTLTLQDDYLTKN